MTQPDTVYHRVSIDGHQFIVSERMAQLLVFLADHVVVEKVLGLDDIESYQIVIDSKGKSRTATIRV